MQDYVVFVEYKDGTLRIENFFNNESTAREYARVKTRDSKIKSVFYACKVLK